MRTILVDLPCNFGFARDVFRGIAAGILVHPGWSLLPIENYQYFIDSGMQVDGAIGFYTRAEAIERAAKVAKICINVSNYAIPHASLVSVINDDYRIGEVAARHFLERGYRRIYFMIWGSGGNLALERWEGMRSTAIAAKAEPVLFHGGTTAELTSFLQSMERPAAVALSSDSLIPFVLRELLNLGWSVPVDAALLGVDNDNLFSGYSNPPISSIRTGAAKIGHTAVQCIISPRQPGTVLRIPPEGIEQRLSTDGFAVEDPRLRKALATLDSTFMHNLDMQTLAASSGVSRRHLTALFSKYLGTTPSHWRENRRLREAKKLLASTTLAIEEVSLRCGYTNSVSFWRAFRRAERMAPGEYRDSFGTPG